MNAVRVAHLSVGQFHIGLVIDLQPVRSRCDHVLDDRTGIATDVKDVRFIQTVCRGDDPLFVRQREPPIQARRDQVGAGSAVAVGQHGHAGLRHQFEEL